MRNSLKKLSFIIFLLALLTYVSGCWDNTDINERSFASAVGLDKGEDGEIEMSLQILRPNIVNAINEGGGDDTAIWVSTKSGETVFDAVREQLKTLNRKPYYNHLQLIVIGEELAKEGIGDIMDFFFRDHEVTITPDVIIAKGMTAKEVIYAESEVETIPSLHLTGILENNVAESKTRDVDFISTIRELTGPYSSTVIGKIEVIDGEGISVIKDLEIEGAAVLKKDKLIGYLDPIETRGYLFINDEVDGGLININHPTVENKRVSIEILRSSGKVKPRIKNDQLVFDINIEVEGIVGEMQGSGGIIDKDLLEQIESSIIKEIEGSVNLVIKAAQDQYETDFIGFGNEVYRNYPQYWKEVEGNWDEEFTDLSININTKVSIEQTGLTSQPIVIQ